MRMMKTCQVHTTGSHQGKALIAEAPVPIPSTRGEVLLRVLSVGLDGTDKEIMKSGYGKPPEGEASLIIGHECLAVVVEAAEDSLLRKGDLVAPIVRRPCRDPHCVNCRNHRQDFCETREYTERGIQGAHGFLSEYTMDEEQYLVRVPEKLLEHGMLVEPQSIVEKVWDELHYIQQRLVWQPKQVLVLGAGPLGLLAALTFRTVGLSVYVWSLDADDSPQAQFARAIGAEYVQSPGEATNSPYKTLTEFITWRQLRFDVVMECTGFSPLAFEAMDAAAPNAVVALLGVSPGKRSLSIPADQLNMEIVLENKCILGSVNASRKHMELAAYRLQKMNELYPGILDRLITKRLTLDELPTLSYEQIGLKAVVDLVPRTDWNQLVRETAQDVQYSFSV